MSDNIPIEIQEEIIKRFPVKSIIRFRSVSKAWKSLIDGPQFIAAHTLLHAHSHRLLVESFDLSEKKEKYVCIVDDDTFPQQNFAPILPSSVKRLKNCMVVGSSHGLFCLSGYYEEFGFERAMAVIWNPSIRKSIEIDMPNDSYCGYEIVFGFGVCPVTSDPKILMASRHRLCDPVHIYVFTLSSRSWRSSQNINLPYESIHFHDSQVVIGRFIYWLVSNLIGIIDDGRICSNKTIKSFDLINDEFGEVRLPDNLSLDYALIWPLKIKESLGLIEEVNEQCFYVWMMEDDVSKSFVKVLTIEAPFASLRILDVLGFRMKTVEPILKVVVTDPDGVSISGALAVYEPVSKRIYYPEIIGSGGLYSVFSYTETLLLVNQPRF